jgi:hypothetical protein
MDDSEEGPTEADGGADSVGAEWFRSGRQRTPMVLTWKRRSLITIFILA